MWPSFYTVALRYQRALRGPLNSRSIFAKGSAEYEKILFEWEVSRSTYCVSHSRLDKFLKPVMSNILNGRYANRASRSPLLISTCLITLQWGKRAKHTLNALSNEFGLYLETSFSTSRSNTIRASNFFSKQLTLEASLDPVSVTGSVLFAC